MAVSLRSKVGGGDGEENLGYGVVGNIVSNIGSLDLLCFWQFFIENFVFSRLS